MTAAPLGASRLTIRQVERILGKEARSIYGLIKHGPLQGVLSMSGQKEGDGCTFPASDVYRARDVLAGLAPRQDPRHAPAAGLSIAEAARMLGKPIDRTRDLLAAFGARIDFDEVAALVPVLADLGNVSRALITIGTNPPPKPAHAPEEPATMTTSTKLQPAVRVVPPVTEPLPEKPADESVVIFGKRAWTTSGLARSLGFDDVHRVTAAVRALSLQGTEVGNATLWSEEQAQLVRAEIKRQDTVREAAAAKLAEKPATAGKAPAVSLATLLESLLSEQRRTNALLEEQNALLAKAVEAWK